MASVATGSLGCLDVLVLPSSLGPWRHSLHRSSEETLVSQHAVVVQCKAARRMNDLDDWNKNIPLYDGACVLCLHSTSEE